MATTNGDMMSVDTETRCPDCGHHDGEGCGCPPYIAEAREAAEAWGLARADRPALAAAAQVGAIREAVAAAWFAGYDKGNLDGYFGTNDERKNSPYADLDPYAANG